MSALFCRHGWIAAAALTAGAGSAFAERVDLFVFENADGVDTTGLDVWVDVTDGGSYADFVFHNDSTIDSIITAFYIEATAFSTSSLVNGQITDQSAGVSFNEPAVPLNPPGSIDNWGGPWQGVHFSADADPPPAHWGIEPGETLTARFDYSGIGFADLLLALQDPVQFRIAQHIQGLGPNNQFSVWTVNVNVIPLPSSAMLGLAGLAGVAGIGYRRRR